MLRETDTVVVTGCGTSEHAAMAGAALLGARSRDAFEACLDPQADGVLIAISHEAGTAATLAAMKATNARTILITAKPEVETGADLTIATPLVDTSWCHTVGYVSPLLALTAIAGAADESDVHARHRGHARPARPLQGGRRRRSYGCERLIVTGSGVDEITARELALKIEEGLHVPVTPLGLEKVLHGHLPAADARTGIVVIRIDPANAPQRDKRADDVQGRGQGARHARGDDRRPARRPPAARGRDRAPAADATSSCSPPAPTPT